MICGENIEELGYDRCCRFFRVHCLTPFSRSSILYVNNFPAIMTFLFSLFKHVALSDNFINGTSYMCAWSGLLHDYLSSDVEDSIF